MQQPHCKPRQERGSTHELSSESEPPLSAQQAQKSSGLTVPQAPPSRPEGRGSRGIGL